MRDVKSHANRNALPRKPLHLEPHSQQAREGAWRQALHPRQERGVHHRGRPQVRGLRPQGPERLRGLEGAARAGAAAVSGTVKLFCSVTACYMFIPRLLNELHLKAPGLEVKIETGDPAESIGRLRAKGGPDLAISALPNEVDEDISFVDLVTFPLILLAPKKPRFDCIGGSDLSGYDLEEVPFIMPERGQLRYEVDKWFSAQGVTPKIYSEVAGHEAIVSLTGLGFGLSVVPKLVYDISPFKNDVFILRELPWADFRVALCSLKKNAQKPLIKAVNRVASSVAPSFEPDLTRRRSGADSVL